MKSDFAAVAASMSKINEATLEALHFVERGNNSFAAGALRLGEQHLQELANEYSALLKRVARG